MTHFPPPRDETSSHLFFFTFQIFQKCKILHLHWQTTDLKDSITRGTVPILTLTLKNI